MATPKTSQPIFTKFGIRDSVTDIYTCAKFHDDQSRYLVTMYMKLCEPYFFYIFGGFLQLSTVKARRTMRFRARMCFFVDRKFKLIHRPLYKNRRFGYADTINIYQLFRLLSICLSSVL